MGYSRITAVATYVAMTFASQLASANPALTAASQARCEAFASLRYAMSLAVDDAVSAAGGPIVTNGDPDAAYEDAYAGCVEERLSFERALAQVLDCELMVSGVERSNLGTIATWSSFCRDDDRE